MKDSEGEIGEWQLREREWVPSGWDDEEVQGQIHRDRGSGPLLLEKI